MKVLLQAACVAALATGAQSAVLDFESFSAGDVITSFDVDGITGTVAAVGGSDDAMVFDTDNPTGSDGDLAAPFYAELSGSNPPAGTPVPGTETLSPGNVLIISEDGDSSDPDDNASGGTITFTFDTLVRFKGFDVFDDVDDFSVSAVGVGGATFSSALISLDFDNQFLSVDGLNWDRVREVTFDFGNASGAIDNIAFAAVPVPASMPLLAAGIGGLVIARRRRRKA